MKAPPFQTGESSPAETGGNVMLFIVTRNRSLGMTSPGALLSLSGRLVEGIGKVDLPVDDIHRPTLGFVVNAADILAHDAKRQQLHPRKERNNEHRPGQAWRQVEPHKLLN